MDVHVKVWMDGHLRPTLLGRLRRDDLKRHLTQGIKSYTVTSSSTDESDRLLSLSNGLRLHKLSATLMLVVFRR